MDQADPVEADSFPRPRRGHRGFLFPRNADRRTASTPSRGRTMKRIGLLALVALVGLSPAWAAEAPRTYTIEELNRGIARERAKGPQEQRPHTLSCWEGGVRVLQEKDVTIRHYTGVSQGRMLLSVVRKDGREIVVYPNGGLCVLEEQ